MAADSMSAAVCSSPALARTSAVVIRSMTRHCGVGGPSSAATLEMLAVDVASYAVLCYRLGHPGLPLAPVAVLLVPLWLPLACPGRDIRLLAVRDELGHVVVKLGHRLVERSEPGSMCPRELCQVSIGHLAVTDDSLGGDIGVRDIVGPEFMPRVGGGAVDDFSCGAGRLAFADEQPYQAALSDRARREVSAHAGEPVLGGTMVNMIFNEEGDEHVRVEENGH